MPGQLPSEIRLQKNLLIKMSDGVNLAADLFLPEGEGPFPTLVSYYPYHKDDLIGSMLDFPCRYFAEHGYAHLLVDLRGLGSSEGVAWEAIDPRENKDGAEVVEWAASQPWCDGNVGMWGISYGGVTALQSASEQPPHLKAIVPIYASVDVYSDLIYPGGCLNCLSAFGTWGSFMTAMNLMPPGYQDPEGRWQASTDGGEVPQWSADGDAVYYEWGRRVFKVEVARRGSGLRLSSPSVLLDGREHGLLPWDGYHVSDDGTRVVTVRDVEAEESEKPPPGIHVVENWLRAFGQLSREPSR